MSAPRSETPPHRDGAGKRENEPVSPGQKHAKTTEDDDNNPGMVTSDDVDGSTGAVDELRKALRSLKTPPDNSHTRGLCNDGVMRIMIWLPTPDDEVTRIGVYDAQPLSPRMIKTYLDRKPWIQAVEDRFRGVDGRNVPEAQWLNPPPGVLPFPGTHNERDAAVERSRKKRKQLEERIARGEIREEDMGPACGTVISDYNLDPR